MPWHSFHELFRFRQALTPSNNAPSPGGLSVSGPCHISKLPTELIHCILAEVVYCTPPSQVKHGMATLALVHSTWRTHTQYLSTLTVVFDPVDGHEASSKTEQLEKRLTGGKTAACHSLHVRWKNYAEQVPERLYRLVSPTLRRLDIRGTYAIVIDSRLGLPPLDLLDSAVFPNLEEILFDCNFPSIATILYTIALSDSPPSTIVLHHDFELEKESRRLRLPLSVLPDTSKAVVGPVDQQQSLDRKPLHIFAERRSHFVQAIEVLTKYHGIPKRDGGISCLEIRLKDGEERIIPIEELIESQRWGKYVEPIIY